MRDIDVNLKVNLVYFQNSLEAWLALTLDKDLLKTRRNMALAELLACFQDLSHRLILMNVAFDKVFPKNAINRKLHDD